MDEGRRRDNSVEELDSAATTLLASPDISPKAHSSVHEDGRAKRYADVELERFDESMRRRRNTWDAQAETEGEEEDEDRTVVGENEGLLAHDNDTTLRALSDAAECSSVLGGEEEAPAPPTDTTQEKRQVSWKELPRKGQLAILTLARLSEPLTQTSLQSYMFYQLKSFKTATGNAPSDSTVARQAGLLAAAFTGAQFLTAIMWGRLADSEMFGRKRVILIGLLGTAIGSLGFGFSESFAVAMLWRAAGGMLNGNMGVMRTMISEIVKEKKFQSRAFLLLPMTFNIGVIVGPLLGGLLADPAGVYPGTFGPGGTLGGKDGVWLFVRWPYALPNLVNATFLLASAVGVVLALEETLEGLKDNPDYGRRLGSWIMRTLFRRKTHRDYTSLAEHEHAGEIELGTQQAQKPKSRAKLPFRRIWTKNVLFTLLCHGLLAMHVGTFSNLWFVFLSTPRYTTHQSELHLPEDYHPELPFTFTGGLALPPPAIGTALAILGVIGITLQLLLFPRLSFRLGTLRSFRLSLCFFPFSYFLAPFLAIIPTTMEAPHQASGTLVWIGITFVLTIQVIARTFALPSTAILVNNSSPHPSVLGTIHGIAQSVSSATRTIGPVLFGWIYGVGLEKGIVGTAWWSMACVAIVGAFAGRFVQEGDGHEIWLSGDKDEEDKG
ncbi:membrane [Lecanosticta acicola]|uniref:Membrane, partial n=1 Tax=Lecanosticta acicola TaxID=111012 RepID=A0AAI8YUQ7_9PEZI|nr:membrane [Lecanosticta acicola]